MDRRLCGCRRSVSVSIVLSHVVAPFSNQDFSTRVAVAVNVADVASPSLVERPYRARDGIGWRVRLIHGLFGIASRWDLAICWFRIASARSWCFFFGRQRCSQKGIFCLRLPQRRVFPAAAADVTPKARNGNRDAGVLSQPVTNGSKALA